MATVFETLKGHNLTDRGMMPDILKNALRKKDYVTALCIAHPYPYYVQGEAVMLKSLVFPIVHDDSFLGIIASDIVLDSQQTIVTGGLPIMVTNHAKRMDYANCLLAI